MKYLPAFLLALSMPFCLSSQDAPSVAVKSQSAEPVKETLGEAEKNAVKIHPVKQDKKTKATISLRSQELNKSRQDAKRQMEDARKHIHLAEKEKVRQERFKRAEAMELAKAEREKKIGEASRQKYEIHKKKASEIRLEAEKSWKLFKKHVKGCEENGSENLKEG